MIALMRAKAGKAEVTQVCQRIEALGVTAHIFRPGSAR